MIFCFKIFEDIPQLLLLLLILFESIVSITSLLIFLFTAESNKEFFESSLIVKTSVKRLPSLMSSTKTK